MMYRMTIALVGLFLLSDVGWTQPTSPLEK